MSSAYLLILERIFYDISHQHGQQLNHPVDVCSEGRKVPSGAALPNGWPTLRATSTHSRVTESTT